MNKNFVVEHSQLGRDESDVVWELVDKAEIL